MRLNSWKRVPVRRVRAVGEGEQRAGGRGRKRTLEVGGRRGGESHRGRSFQGERMGEGRGMEGAGVGERGRDVRRRRREPRARTPRAPSTHDSSELKAGYSERDPEAEE